MLVVALRGDEPSDDSRFGEGGILHCLRVGGLLVICGRVGLTFLSLLARLFLAGSVCLSAKD